MPIQGGLAWAMQGGLDKKGRGMGQGGAGSQTAITLTESASSYTMQYKTNGLSVYFYGILRILSAL